MLINGLNVTEELLIDLPVCPLHMYFQLWTHLYQPARRSARRIEIGAPNSAPNCVHTYIHTFMIHAYIMHTYIYSTPSTLGASIYTYIHNTCIYHAYIHILYSQYSRLVDVYILSYYMHIQLETSIDAPIDCAPKPPYKTAIASIFRTS